MASVLTSRRYDVDDFREALELPFRNGWTDGLPVIPPTEDRVNEFLEYASLEPDQVVAEAAERGRIITAEKLAINAVMAGCLPEYMPVLVAVLEAVTDPQFKFNHIASLGAPWPLIIVNGPIAREIGLNSGAYLFGPGSRPNATIARAISLVLRNCAEAKVEGIQRGQWGHPGRWCGCISEIEDAGWEPRHVQRGFDKSASTVTVVSTYPGIPYHVSTLMLGERPPRMLNTVCHSLAHWGGAQWTIGTYVLMVGPHMAEIFVREGWSKDDVRNYILENTKVSVAELKDRGAWGIALGNLTEEVLQVQPGDESRYVYLFKDAGEYEEYLFTTSATEGRVVDVLVVVAGGNAGHRMGLAFPYQYSTNPVTKEIGTR